MSGTTSWASKAQKCVPRRPKPVCTSSAMQTPPAARTRAYTSARNPCGSMICPPTLGQVSAMKPAETVVRFAARSAIDLPDPRTRTSEPRSACAHAPR